MALLLNTLNNTGQPETKQIEPPNNNVVLLKADLHCHGCGSKLINCIRSFHGLGVENVTIGDDQMITVTGKVTDLTKLLEAVDRKTHMKVGLISPNPKYSAGEGKKKKKKNYDMSDDDEKKLKEKEPPVTTTSLKINLHCEGCIQRIYKIISKTEGYQGMKIEEQKDLVTVTGAIDIKALVVLLQKRLKKKVEIIKKDGDKEDGKEKDAGAEKQEVKKQPQKIFVHPYPSVYGSGIEGDPFQYNPYPAGSYHAQAQQMFSDENASACRVL